MGLFTRTPLIPVAQVVPAQSMCETNAPGKSQVDLTIASTLAVGPIRMLVQGIETPLGPLTALWSNLGLCRLQFGHAEAQLLDWAQARAVASAVRSAGPSVLQSAVNEYFAGGEFDFPWGQIDWTGIPEFHQRALVRCMQLRRGETLTYGQLAAEIGSPQAARAVGQAMARNRLPLVIPCHRLLGSTGKLTGYSAADGVATKSQLLAFERQSRPWQVSQLQLAYH